MDCLALEGLMGRASISEERDEPGPVSGMVADVEPASKRRIARDRGKHQPGRFREVGLLVTGATEREQDPGVAG